MCSIWEKVLGIVQILGLDKFLHIYADRKTALKSLPKKGES